MRIWIAYCRITKIIYPEAFVNKAIAEEYIENNDMLELKELHLDTTVDPKRPSVI